MEREATSGYHRLNRPLVRSVQIPPGKCRNQSCTSERCDSNRCLFRSNYSSSWFHRPTGAEDVVDIGSRRELFVDHFLIDKLAGTRLELQRPRPAEVAIRYDQPWEDHHAFYTTVLKDKDTFRMYYRGPRRKSVHDLLRGESRRHLLDQAHAGYCHFQRFDEK